MTIKLDQRIYDRLFTCVHCGLCLGQCPTYAQLGDENDSPRGRILLMRAVVEGRLKPTEAILKHLSMCLDCRACETACPSGVKYGSLIENVRDEIGSHIPKPPEGIADRLIERLILDYFPDREKLSRMMVLARLADAVGWNEFLGESGLGDVLPGPLARLNQMMPKIAGRLEPMPEHVRPEGQVRARVAFFIGCVSESMFGATNRATLKVLVANGVEVFAPPMQVCCGAIHHHNGQPEIARELARRNINVFESILAPIEAIVTNVGGCGAMLKDYAELLEHDKDYAERAKRFVSKVRDINEFLYALPLRTPDRPLPMRVTYHDSCHLAHVQKIRQQPRRLLAAVPGLELVELPESDWCCGAAGTYNLTHPEMSDDLAERKLANIESTGARVVAAANAGCMLQIAAYARRTGRELRVVHPIDLLAEAYE